MPTQDYRSELLRIEDVVGAGTGNEGGRDVLIVMLKRDNPVARKKIAKILKGIDYRIAVTGEFRSRELDSSER